MCTTRSCWGARAPPLKKEPGKEWTPVGNSTPGICHCVQATPISGDGIWPLESVFRPLCLDTLVRLNSTKMLTSVCFEGESYISTKMVSIVVLGDEICSTRIVRGPSSTIKELSVKEPVFYVSLEGCQNKGVKRTDTLFMCVQSYVRWHMLNRR